MNEKEMMAAIYYYAYLNEERQNASYVFTEAEERRFYRAIEKCSRRIDQLSETHFDEDVFSKLYGE
jgi:hypothetical protein